MPKQTKTPFWEAEALDLSRMLTWLRKQKIISAEDIVHARIAVQKERHAPRK
jgi:hypothetical protein